MEIPMHWSARLHTPIFSRFAMPNIIMSGRPSCPMAVFPFFSMARWLRPGRSLISGQLTSPSDLPKVFQENRLGTPASLKAARSRSFGPRARRASSSNLSIEPSTGSPLSPIFLVCSNNGSTGYQFGKRLHGSNGVDDGKPSMAQDRMPREFPMTGSGKQRFMFSAQLQRRELLSLIPGPKGSGLEQLHKPGTLEHENEVVGQLL